MDIIEKLNGAKEFHNWGIHPGNCISWAPVTLLVTS